MREREVAGADEHHVDALDLGDLPRVAHAPRRLDHQDHHDRRARTPRRRPRSRRAAGRRRRSAARAAGSGPRARPSAPAFAVSTSGTITPSAPASSASPMASGAVLGHAHHHRHVRRRRADARPPGPCAPTARAGGRARSRPVLLRAAISHQRHAAEREPDDAEAVAAVDAVAQGRAARVEHGSLHRAVAAVIDRRAALPPACPKCTSVTRPIDHVVRRPVHALRHHAFEADARLVQQEHAVLAADARRRRRTCPCRAPRAGPPKAWATSVCPTLSTLTLNAASVSSAAAMDETRLTQTRSEGGSALSEVTAVAVTPTQAPDRSCAAIDRHAADERPHALLEGGGAGGAGEGGEHRSVQPQPGLLHQRQHPVAEEGQLVGVVDEGQRRAGIALVGDPRQVLDDRFRRADQRVAAGAAGEALAVEVVGLRVVGARRTPSSAPCGSRPPRGRPPSRRTWRSSPPPPPGSRGRPRGRPCRCRPRARPPPLARGCPRRGGGRPRWSEKVENR